jgi:hypothetical protein
MDIHEVSGGGGLHLHVREWGPKNGPAILFIHEQFCYGFVEGRPWLARALQAVFDHA